MQAASSQRARHYRKPSNARSLDIILQDPVLLSAFEKRVAAEFGMESILFLKDR
jgi:hypothetical protein